MDLLYPVLDSYLYGLEFHVMFFKNNIRNGNIALLSEYFGTLGPVAGFPNLLLAEFINHYILLYAAPSLAISLAAAFGKVSGFLLCLIASAVVALVSYGLGRFFLGDILPSFNISIKRDWRLDAAWGTLFAVPMLTILCPAILASFFRIRIWEGIQHFVFLKRIDEVDCGASFFLDRLVEEYFCNALILHIGKTHRLSFLRLCVGECFTHVQAGYRVGPADGIGDICGYLIKWSVEALQPGDTCARRFI